MKSSDEWKGHIFLKKERVKKRVRTRLIHEGKKKDQIDAFTEAKEIKEYEKLDMCDTKPFFS